MYEGGQKVTEPFFFVRMIDLWFWNAFKEFVFIFSVVPKQCLFSTIPRIKKIAGSQVWEGKRRMNHEL